MKRSHLRVSLVGAGLAVGLAVLLGRRWVALGWQAWNYPAATPSTRTQIAVGGGYAYVAAGAAGIEVIDLAARGRKLLLPPSGPADRVDDLAVADGLLFALDATSPGHLSVYSLAD